MKISYIRIKKIKTKLQSTQKTQNYNNSGSNSRRSSTSGSSSNSSSSGLLLLQFHLQPAWGAKNSGAFIITSSLKTKWVAPKLDNKAAVCCL